MKNNNIIDKIKFLVLFASGIMLVESCDKTPYGQDFDLSYPTPSITNVITTGEVGTGMTLLGSNFDKVIDVRMSGNIISNKDFLVQTPNVIVVNLPRTFSTGAITVDNIYRRVSTSTSVVSPIYPNTSITGWPTVIVKDSSVLIVGINMDLITQVNIGSNKIGISGGKIDSIRVPTSGLILTTDSAVVSVSQSLSVVVGNTSSPILPVVAKPKK